MKISFFGAAREVTGSCHRVQSNGKSILLDCGMIQGGKERHERNREPFPFEPRELDGVILSHAHIDHSGRLPLLCKNGFRGPIWATPPTVKLCEILLQDSAHIQEEDARWKIKRLKKRGKPYDWVTPLYTKEDVLCILDRFRPVPFDQPVTIDGFGEFRFTKAGHILGASIVQIAANDGGDQRRLVFSGDLGVEGARLVGGPQSVPTPHDLIIESTYGDRDRDKTESKTERLHEVITQTVGRGGNVVIPSFAVGRTQAILARINDLVEQNRMPSVPVFVDSPMAIAATGAFAMFPEAYSDEARRLLKAGDRPLEFSGLKLSRTVEESKAISASRVPCVIISASGMATAGRIKHHLKHNIGDAKSTVAFVGYQARNSLGRVIQQGTDPVRIFGDWYDVRAKIETIEGFSAHADRGGLLDWFESLGGPPERTFVVHGEESAAEAFGATLRDRYGTNVEVPELNQSYE